MKHAEGNTGAGASAANAVDSPRGDDGKTHAQAVRFAARSESTEALTMEQRAALEVFVAILSEEPGEA